MAKKPFLILIAGLLCLSAFGQKDVIIIDHGTDITKGRSTFLIQTATAKRQPSTYITIGDI